MMKKAIIILFGILFLTLNVLAQNAIPPASGDGSSDNPYTIESLENLYWIASEIANWDKHYIQTADIDASSTAPWFGNQGWVAIGTNNDRFTGSYDGQAYAIEGLFMSYADVDYQGLFGYVMDATLKNISLINVTINGYSRVGGLAGAISNSNVENVSVSGTITGLSTWTGGVFGTISGGLFHRVSANVVVQGTINTGGIAGYISNHAEFRHSYSSGSVSGTDDVGGFAGQLMNGQQFITDSYSHASVVGTNRVGGFVGHLWAGTLYRSFSTGQVTGSGNNVGGLIGQGNGFVYFSYWDVETSGQQISAGGGEGPEGKTTAEMFMQNTYKYYNFNTLWQIDNGYPFIRNFSNYAALEIPDLAELAGTGTDNDPYLIHNANELAAMHQDMEAHYRLANEIDLTASVIWNYGKGWHPVGTSTVGLQFKGSLDGNGHAISYLSINIPQQYSYAGLFGYASGATLVNIKLIDVSVCANTGIGSLAGEANNCNVENIIASGTLVGISTRTGGVFGTISGGLVHLVSADVNVRGITNTGGIAGYVTNSAEIRHCYVTGHVTGTNDVGGFAGQMMQGMQFITDSYSHASVSGQDRVGGFVGHLWAGTVYRSFSTGQVDGTGNNVGGFIGQGNGFVYDSFWDVETSGQTSSAGGGPGPTGMTTDEMFTQSTFKYYNFNTLWEMDNGYPHFKDLSVYAALEIPDLSELAGTGTANDPYLIHNANELAAMHQDMEAHYRLANDVDLSASVIWNYGKGWLPIGSSTTGQRFKGALDGYGHEVGTMTVNIPNGSYIGFFGYLEQAHIENLKMLYANIQADQSAGLLAGSILNSELDHLEASGNIISRLTVGGLAGNLNNSQASRVMVNSKVKGGSRTGGIVGIMSNGSALRYAMSFGEAIGADYVGGLVGEMSTGSPQVQDCYSRADIIGADRVGGLIGYIWTGAVNNAYSTGLVQGTGNYVGGLTGQGANAFNSFWDIETSGQTTSSAGMGKTTAEMKTESTFTDADWDFVEVWTINENHNDGYPQLRWLQPVGMQELPAEMDLVVFPNPSNGLFTIRFHEMQPVVRIVVTNTVGVTYHNQTYSFTKEIPVNLKSYPHGLHFITIDTGTSRQVVKVLIL